MLSNRAATALRPGRFCCKRKIIQSDVVALTRAVSTSKSLKWDPVKFQTHVSDKGALDDEIGFKFVDKRKEVAIIGAPMTYGQPLLGTDMGPQMLRDAGLHATLKDLGWQVDETGDLQFDPPKESDPKLDPKHGTLRHPFAVGTGLKKIRDAVKEKAEDGKFVITLGGDHSVGAGSISGVLSVRPETGVIWVDAHADINTPKTSPSGNIHGMPIAFLVKGLANPMVVPGFEWMGKGPYLDHQKLVYIGLRDIDEGERRLIKKLNIKAFTMQEVDRHGIGKTMEMALDHLNSHGDYPIHLSYDIDAVDPLVAPSTGTIVRGGLTWREAHFVAEAIAETGALASLDMVEVNPALTPGEGAKHTVEMGLHLIASSLGNRIL